MKWFWLALLALPVLSQTNRPPANSLEANYEQAVLEYEADPANIDKLIWMGRRLGYLGRYDEAIAVYTKGIGMAPKDARLYRHRGHRYISTRRFRLAIADFEEASRLQKGKKDEIEPDGQPNKLNKPLSTLQFNIYYHWGLAHYLLGEYEEALKAYTECMKRSHNNDDSLVATTDWMYMTLRRLGKKNAAEKLLAPVTEKMDIIENTSYWKRLLMYKGVLKPEDLLAEDADALTLATQGYGVGNWYLYNGETKKARNVFEKVVQGTSTSAFGYIAAEVELERMNGK
jgi:tetratricopeptide (TPR) repeat protein